MNSWQKDFDFQEEGDGGGVETETVCHGQEVPGCLGAVPANLVCQQTPSFATLFLTLNIQQQQAEQQQNIVWEDKWTLMDRMGDPNNFENIESITDDITMDLEPE